MSLITLLTLRKQEIVINKQSHWQPNGGENAACPGVQPPGMWRIRIAAG